MIILGENTFFNNGYKENANNLVIGAPGTGKSRGFVIPNLCEANNESILLLDPKGELYNITHKMMAKKGYKILVIDFEQPEKSPNYYNPLSFIKSQDDVVKFSSIMVTDKSRTTADPFWPQASTILCNALTDYLVSYRPKEQQVLSSIEKLLRAASPHEYDDEAKTRLDVVFNNIADAAPWCRSQYTLVRNSAARTMKSVIVSLAAEFCPLLTPEIIELTSKNTIDPKTTCDQKTIVYVKCSDTDRSKDKLVALFFTQFINEVYKLADKSPSGSLPRPLHIILDDMGANLTIPDLDCKIATSRGRDISFSLILQSFGQLKKNYIDYTSIVSSCNNLIFLGSNDIETCRDIATRLNKPLTEALYKEKDTVFIFQQGKKSPITTKVYNLKKHPHFKDLSSPYTTPPNRNKKATLDCEVEYDAV